MNNPELKPTTTAPMPVPPDEKFWVHYSPRMEFSISGLASITVHVLLFLMFFLIVGKLMNLKTTPPDVPFKSLTISDQSGDDDVGSTGSGGGAPIDKSDDVTVPTVATPDIPQVDLDKIKINVSQWIPEMANDKDVVEIIANSPVREKLENMDKGLRNELLKGLGEKKGSGNGPGSGSTNQEGVGEGGDSARAKSRKRALGWTLKFDTRDVRNYLDQLAMMKATLIFQKPGSDGLDDALVFTDLSTGAAPKKYTKDMKLSSLFFIDNDPSSYRGVAEELKLPFRPPQMVVLFPKDVEEELAQKSMGYHNRREEDIVSTTFQIRFANGKFEIAVIKQSYRKSR